MAFALDKVVPWGRSYEEYVRMFNLTERELEGRILGCGDGPASFNAEATQRGHSVISCDPIYQFTAAEIAQRIDEAYQQVIDQLGKNTEDYVWDLMPTPEAVGQTRMAAMRRFLDDFPRGVKEGRYVDASLPYLPFQDKEFDLALCSHFLFLYTEQLSQEFHLDSIIELCRVATEVRIFPLLNLGVNISAYVAPVTAALEQRGGRVEFRRVPYEFQKGAHTAMYIVS
ncbi:MAG: SAM-dependent methyltransferase [Chloroflexi bacterium]|nr:SAM-dependent methyltransferase [Chloroflexota bacterium]